MLNNVIFGISRNARKIKRRELVLMDRKEIYFWMMSQCYIGYIIYYMKNVKHWMQRLKRYIYARMHILSSWFCISFINLIVVRQKTVTDHYSKYVWLPFTQQKGRYEYSSNYTIHFLHVVNFYRCFTNVKAISVFYRIKKDYLLLLFVCKIEKENFICKVFLMYKV